MKKSLLLLSMLVACNARPVADLKSCYGDDTTAIIPVKVDKTGEFVIVLILMMDGSGTFVAVSRPDYDSLDLSGKRPFPQTWCDEIRAEALKQLPQGI